MPQGQQEFVVQCREWIPRLADQDQRRNHRVAPEDGQDGGVGVCRAAARSGIEPVTGELWPAGFDHSPEHSGGRRREPALGPAGADARAPNEPAAAALDRVKGGSSDRGEGEGPRQQGIEHILLPVGPLKVTRQRRPGTQRSLAPHRIRVGTSSRLSGVGSSGSCVRARCRVASRLPGKRCSSAVAPDPLGRHHRRIGIDLGQRAPHQALGLEVDADVAHDRQARKPRRQRRLAAVARDSPPNRPG